MLTGLGGWGGKWSSCLIKLALSLSMQSSSFQELPSAVLAGCSSCYHSLTNAGVMNVKVPSAKHTFLVYSIYARNKCLFTWQHGKFNIYHKHSTKCSYLAEHPTLYLSKINQGLLFMLEWVCYLKMLITYQLLCSGQQFAQLSNTFFLCLLAKKMKFTTLLKAKNTIAQVFKTKNTENLILFIFTAVLTLNMHLKLRNK